MKNLLTPWPLIKDNAPSLSACITHSDAHKEARTQKADTWLDMPLFGCAGPGHHVSLCKVQDNKTREQDMRQNALSVIKISFQRTKPMWLK